MTNLNDHIKYKEYFQALASSHIDIDDFYYGDENVSNSNVRSGGTGKIMWLDYYGPVRIQDNRNDNIIGTIRAVLVIMGVPANDKLATKQSFYLELENIVQEIISRIEYDYQNGTLENEPDLSQAQFGESIDHLIGGTKFQGCRLELPFLVPLKLTYDPAKWQ